MKAHHARRRKPSPLPLGAMQLCLSFKPPVASSLEQEELPQERARVLQADQTFGAFCQELASADDLLGGQGAYSETHAKDLEQLLLWMRECLQGYLDRWEQSGELAGQSLLWQGRLLYRELGEALVAARDVRGVCATRCRHVPTDVFGALVDAVDLLRRHCQKIATLIEVKPSACGVLSA